MFGNRAIGFELRALTIMIKRKMESLPTPSDTPLTGIQLWAIGYLYHHQDEDVFQRDLETLFSIRRSTATAILQVMEKNDLIRREPVEHDARLKKLILTDKAINAHTRATENINLLEKTLTNGISEDELAAFFCTIDKLKKNLEELP